VDPSEYLEVTRQTDPLPAVEQLRRGYAAGEFLQFFGDCSLGHVAVFLR
jgi:hypothetical protein